MFWLAGICPWTWVMLLACLDWGRKGMCWDQAKTTLLHKSKSHIKCAAFFWHGGLRFPRKYVAFGLKMLPHPCSRQSKTNECLMKVISNKLSRNSKIFHYWFSWLIILLVVVVVVIICVFQKVETNLRYCKIVKIIIIGGREDLIFNT